MRKLFFLFILQVSTMPSSAIANNLSNENVKSSVSDTTKVSTAFADRVFIAAKLQQYSGQYMMENNPNCYCKQAYGYQITGNATYQYKEVDDSRVLHGAFQFAVLTRKKTFIRNDRYPFDSYSLLGTYNKGKRNGKWIITFKSNDKSYDKSVISGSYKNGRMDGPWDYTEFGTANLDKWKVTFKDGKLSGNFLFENSNVKIPTRVSGVFDENGNIHGDWIVTTSNGNDLPTKIVFNYYHGFLYKFKIVNQTSGETDIQNFDQTKRLIEQANWVNDTCNVNDTLYYRNAKLPDILTNYRYIEYYSSYIPNKIKGWGGSLFPALLIGIGFEEAPRCKYFLHKKGKGDEIIY
ncbi:MAG: hypothetical protein WCJ61_06845 [Paludibacter sp.]